jgi:hypothetical protein
MLPSATSLNLRRTRIPHLPTQYRPIDKSSKPHPIIPIHQTHIHIPSSLKRKLVAMPPYKVNKPYHIISIILPNADRKYQSPNHLPYLRKVINPPFPIFSVPKNGWIYITCGYLSRTLKRVGTPPSLSLSLQQSSSHQGVCGLTSY